MLLQAITEIALLGAFSFALVYGMWYVGTYMDVFMRSIYGMK